MNKPKMFSRPVKKYQPYPVYVIVSKDNGKRFKTDLMPAHYTVKNSADFMIDVLGRQKTYNTLELMYNPNEGTYERS